MFEKPASLSCTTRLHSSTDLFLEGQQRQTLHGSVTGRRLSRWMIGKDMFETGIALNECLLSSKLSAAYLCLVVPSFPVQVLKPNLMAADQRILILSGSRKRKPRSC
eukprot:208971-Hanusia_phi.AAC.3